MHPDHIRTWVNFHIGQPLRKRGFWARLKEFFQ